MGGPEVPRRKRPRLVALAPLPKTTDASSVPPHPPAESAVPTERHTILQQWGADVALWALPPQWPPLAQQRPPASTKNVLDAPSTASEPLYVPSPFQTNPDGAVQNGHLHSPTLPASPITRPDGKAAGHSSNARPEGTGYITDYAKATASCISATLLLFV